MSDTEATDLDLVERANQSPSDDLGAFEELVQRYQTKVLGNCRYLTGSRDDAEDLAQEVFVKAYYALGRFEGRSSFRTWLWRIKVNHCLNFLQRRKRARFVSVEEPGLDGATELQVQPMAEGRLQQQTDHELIGQSLDAMPETVRVPLLLRDLDGLSYQDIADELALSLSATKMRIKRGREEFRRRDHAGLAAREQIDDSARQSRVDES